MRKRSIFLLCVFILLGCSRADLDARKADRLSLATQKSYQEAVRLYQRALTARPKGGFSDNVRLKLGRLFLKGGDTGAAIEEFRKVNTREAQVLLAEALLKDSDFTGALESFNKIGAQGDAEYLYFYGLALEKNNLYDKAQVLFARVASDPVYGARAKRRIGAMNHNNALVAYGGVDEEVKKLILASPGQEKYPEASGLYLLTDDNIVLTPDDRLITGSHYVIKILNDRGKEKFGEVVLPYDSTYQKLELEMARTIMPDGTVVTVGDKNIRDVSVYLNYPLYSNARARIISMPEVTAGATIEYRVKITQAQLPNKKDFDTSYWLQSDEPILYQRSTLTIPKERALKYKTVNASYNTFGFNMTPQVRQEKDTTVFFLEFKDVPQIIPEPMMPPLSRIDAYILFSTFQSWQDIYTWWRDLYKDKISSDADIAAKVLELTRDKKIREDKLRAIYNFCASEIRYVAVEYGDAGYEPHKATEIFKNKYGDCKDKVILLVAMLKEAGIDAYPVLVSTSDSFDVQEDLPNILFNHAIAACEVKGELIFMDVTASTASFLDLPPDDQGRTALVFFKDKYQLVRTPIFPSSHNKVSTFMKMKVARDESIEAERKVDAAGSYQQAQRYWLKYTMPALIEEGLKQKVRSIVERAVLKNYEIKNVDDLDKPVSLKYTFSAPQYFTRAGKARLMAQLSNIDTAGLAKDTRRYPIEFSQLDEDEEMIEVELPVHLAVKYVPQPVTLETKWFYFTCRYDVINKKSLRFFFTRKTKERVVSPTEYAAYKKAIEDLVPLVNQQVVLEETR